MDRSSKILIVDDEPLVLDTLREPLLAHGYAVYTERGGEEAIERLNKEEFDLILLDIVMPGVDGFQVMDHVFRESKDTLVIVVTGYGSAESAIEALKRGAYYYISKPIENEELLKLVKNALDANRLEKERKKAEEALQKAHDELESRVRERTEKLVKANERLAHEVEKRRKGEAVLKESEERYRSLVENTMDGYFICEIPSGRFLFLNQRSCDLYGCKMQKDLKFTLWDVISSSDHGRIQEQIQERLEGKEMISEPQNCIAVRKDGSTFQAEVSTSLVTFQGKHALQGVLRDVTEKKRLEQQLHQARKMEAIGTLAGGIAHDFNNLLMAIQGNASLMLLDTTSDHPNYEKLKNIEGCVQSGGDLTRRLLGFARAGKYDVKSIDINELIRKSSEMFGRTKKEITINLKLQEKIWTTEVDQSQIEQVFLNLYVNAWQAMPGGGEIFLETENVTLDETYSKTFKVRTGKYIKISITDTGEGMREDNQKRVFEPFFTTKEMGKGAGLGLASVYGIVKNHGGYIVVKSEKGVGTTFTIHLPASVKPIIGEKKFHLGLSKGKEDILLIDDEDMVLEATKRMLESLDYRVLAARSGKEGIDLYKANRDKIDIVILDMVMPKMSGGEVYERLREMNPMVKVLLSSGYSINSRAKEIVRKGCNGFIQKPFDIKVLSQKVREILSEEQESVAFSNQVRL
jgi:PAS domain S-box-containing protein